MKRKEKRKRIGGSLSARKSSASILKVQQAHDPPLQLWTAFQTLTRTGGPWELCSELSHPLLTQQNPIHRHRWHPEQIWRWSAFASSGTCRKLYAKADNVMKNVFCPKDYCHKLWLFSIDSFQHRRMIRVLTGNDHSVNLKFSWQSVIFSNIQYKNQPGFLPVQAVGPR